MNNPKNKSKLPAEHQQYSRIRVIKTPNLHQRDRGQDGKIKL